MPRSRGSALVLSLLALTLGALIALALTQRASADAARTRALVAWDQAYLDALASETWACRHLSRLAREETAAATDPPVLAQPGSPHHALADAQGRFNLNNLVSAGSSVPPQYLHLVRLLAVLGLPAELAARIADWIDADGDVTWPGGAEAERYRMLRPARRPANRPFGTVGELKDVYGMAPEALRRLLPHVTVLPGLTTVNVNSATPEVLRAVVPGLSPEGAAALVARRRQRPYLSVSDFLREPPVRNLGTDASGLTVTSEYFELETRVENPDTVIVLRSLVHARGQGAASVVRRHVGYF